MKGVGSSKQSRVCRARASREGDADGTKGMLNATEICGVNNLKSAGWENPGRLFLVGWRLML
ncbi:hypothetical protein RB6283 [Rhodopirellula baltica SH 1]|uniref:Uncharacterized protein n=1 Tax=Rhodopirellula baltica (strain DSM 10527 / NCIMB 13988 / SH1) TaxID=243090 RepID=Q7UQJ6_RHOBA|nr:hypothetical protein RB6283 [Rhodopirellula baltica SH 1]